MVRRVLVGAVIGGCLFCLPGSAVGFVIGYMRQFDRSLAVYQRDLWPYAAIFWVAILGLCMLAVGTIGGALVAYWRAKPK